jgi:hypothetical protein
MPSQGRQGKGDGLHFDRKNLGENFALYPILHTSKSFTQTNPLHHHLVHRTILCLKDYSRTGSTQYVDHRLFLWNQDFFQHLLTGGFGKEICVEHRVIFSSLPYKEANNQLFHQISLTKTPRSAIIISKEIP